MARGKSGRIVIEVEPELKNELYEVLAKSGITLKEWFQGEAKKYCSEVKQPDLFSNTHFQPEKKTGTKN